MRETFEIENIPICYQVLNSAGEITHINKLWLDTLGYQRNEVLGLKFTTLLASETELEKLFLDKKHVDIIKLPLLLKHKSGDLIWFELNARHHYNRLSSSQEIHCTLSNTTQQRNTEKKRRETEEQFSQLFEQSPHGIGILTPDGMIHRTNTRFCQMLNYETGELDQVHITKISHPDELSINIKNLDKLLNLEVPTIKQVKRYIKKDGTIIWVEAVSSVIKSNDNKVQYIIGTVEDITERRIADLTRKIVYNISNAVGTSDTLEDLIITIKDQLSTLIDTTNFYVAIYDEDNQQFLLPYYSDQYDEISHESVPAGKSISNYVFKTKKPLLATPEKLRELEEKNEIELLGPASKIWLGIPLIFKNQTFGIMAVQSYDDEHAFSAVDLELLEHVSQQISISVARKKSEEELRVALLRATEADRIKSTFLSTMSHELRTPLNAVIGFSELLVDELEDNELANYAELINNSGNHLLELVEGLFDITLIESGNIKLRKNTYPLQSLLNTVLNLILAEQKKMGLQNIQVKLENNNVDSFTVYTDGIKLKQILINLLKNALKFTHEGSIVFGCVLPKSDADKLMFYVKDTGIGIPADKQSFIFDSFNQIDGRHSRQHDGAGIGLSVAKQLAKLLGGRIWLESEVNKGSQFYFTICYK